MESDKLIDVQWCGIRKDSGKGAIWGWFVESGKSTDFGKKFSYDTYQYEEIQNYCHEFSGSIGRKLVITPHIITLELMNEFKSKERNYKVIEFSKIQKKWSSKFDKELEEYLCFLTLKSYGN